MAGLGRKVFTAGDVLTASDVQSYLMDQTVMNFAGTAARASAIATPTEGMVTYLADTNAVEVYDGAAYVGVGGSSGLTLIKTQTIGTTVSSVNVTGAFSATYENYRVLVSGGVGSAVGLIQLKLGATTTGYYQSATILTYAGGNGSAFVANSANFPRMGVTSTLSVQMDFHLQNPFTTKYTMMNNSYMDARTAGENGWGGGFLDNTTSYTDFTIIPQTGTLTGGTIYVYGYGVS